MARKSRKAKKRTHKEIMQAFLGVVGGLKNARSAFSFVMVSKRKAQIVASKELAVGHIRSVLTEQLRRLARVPNETLWIDAVAIAPDKEISVAIQFAYLDGQWNAVTRPSDTPAQSSEARPGVGTAVESHTADEKGLASRVEELERQLIYVLGLLWKLRNTAKSALTDAKFETDAYLAQPSGNTPGKEK